jgi:hypothetical protein
MAHSQTNLMFIQADLAEERRERADQAKLRGGTSRTWCDPKQHVEIVGVDFGGGQACYHSLYQGEDVESKSFPEMLRLLASMPRGTLVVSERAHLATPQNESSLSQPYTGGELLDLYRACERNGVTIRLMPHGHSRKAREWSAKNGPSGFVYAKKSTDINDARSLAYYVANKNGIALARPPRSFDRRPLRDYGLLVRRSSNAVLNAERNTQYDGSKFPFVASLAARILERQPPLESFVHKTVAFCIASLVIAEVDSAVVRFTYRGRSLGRNSWLKHVAGFSSCHHSGGISRSNMFWHRFRPFLEEYAKARGLTVKTKDNGYVPFGELDEEQEQIRLACLRLIRSQVKDAYSLAVDLSSSSEPYEILDREAFLPSRPLSRSID